MTGILIFAVNPVSSDLKSFLIHQHCYGSVLNPGIHRPWKNCFHLLRFGRRGNIPVSRGAPKDTVTDTTAYRIGIIAMCFQLTNDGFTFSGNSIFIRTLLNFIFSC